MNETALPLNGTSQNATTATVLVHGWVSGPDVRGSWDIIWSSFMAIFLCTWTAICLNIPHPKDRTLHILLRKTKWMFWAVIAPEIVLSIAMGQYASARRSVRRFKKLECEGWTIRHGFFADMGGFLLQPKDSTPFLVNSRQMAYLVEREYIQCPTITEEEIWDRSKADSLSKLITAAQATWLLFQLGGRAVLKLPTTTLELSAGAIVLCSFGTFICWLHKPSDAKSGVTVTTRFTTAQILLDAGPIAAQPYVHTPLDFVSRESPTCGFNMMGFFNLRCDDPERPLRRFPNDRFPDIATFEKIALFLITTAYASFHLIGWNFTFPSRVETQLWRWSSVVVTGATVFFWVFETIAARQRFGRWDKYLIWLRLKKKPADETTPTATSQDGETGSDVERAPKTGGVVRQDTILRMDAFEEEMKKAKPIVFWEVAILFPFILLYVVARAYLIVEVFVSLRELPAGVYKTFEVAEIIPHW
ncbi:hypothetical protein AOL_s00043g744 [Orbilia oligospora ATCC 24927]|uniref:Uncharacterized protein n=1 Tax=Arthrobotrys oligospora (strain ATCC 24927 / CBS 115.81 / DSM 1491) TaxID=756982 RepID=G1X4X0_ARTOA|nr:hypothetical protein AOL_s00043g744 [Orbilia oligospora ATCC 24927]EGX51725.1 hypothetical protein AOL_s00043g744 [Orbilia oligospora ATCC 24927]